MQKSFAIGIGALLGALFCFQPANASYLFPDVSSHSASRHNAAVRTYAARTDRAYGNVGLHGGSLGSGLSRVKLNDGQVIVVASAYADRFVGFFNALYAREGKLPPVTCLASGHMPGSLHHWGAACDAGQTARNRAAAMMYHVGDLAGRFGLTDGCSWRHSPDCGHIDVSGIVFARSRSLRRWASN